MTALRILSLTVLLLAGLVTSLAGAAPAFADPVFATASRIGITPPPGFQRSQTLRGFENPEMKAAILVFELPPTAFDEISKSSNDPLKAQGVIVDKRETVPYRDAKALLFTGHQRDGDSTLRKWIFVAPGDAFTAVVSVQAPDSANNPEFDKAIRESFASTATRSDVPIAEQLETLPFRIADTGGFRPVRVAPPATEVLTKGDKDNFENNAQPLLIVSAAPGAPDSAEARANLANNLFTGFTGLKEIRITGADMIRIEGMQIHQIMADAKNEATGDEVKLVQWLRFGGGNAFIRFVGIARRDDWLPAFSAMRAARDSIGPNKGDRG